MKNRHYYRKLTIIALIVIVSFALSERDVTPALPNSEQNKSLPQAYLKHVVDGDTLIVLQKNREVRVRLIGVDSPENFQGEKTHGLSS